MAAASLDELQRMVKQFRITELQVLLGYVGKQKTGKKQDLMDRALMLLRNPTYNIMSKIKELYSQRTLKANGSVANGGRPNQGSITVYNDSSSYYSNSPTTDHIMTQADLSFITLPFYDHISHILPPTLLRQNCFTNRYQESVVQFSLSPQHTREITNNRKLTSDGVYECDVQVQLRFAPADKLAHDIQDMYPPCLLLRLNGKMVQLPNAIPTNKQNADPKRPPRPLDLTWSCRLTPMVQNNLMVSWATPNEPDLPKTYCYTINLVRRRTSEYLAQKVINQGMRSKHITEANIKAKLSDDEDDIALTSLKVSLLCPLGKMRMATPCLASTCDHIQCFDVRLYLMMNEKKPTWTCPVCDQPAKYQDLIVDELFTEICQVAGDCDEILFKPDGTWVPLGTPGRDSQSVAPSASFSIKQSPVKNLIQDTHSVSDEPKEKAPVDVIVLSDSDDDQSESSSIIQPITRPAKRPISAISSDSSLGLPDSHGICTPSDSTQSSAARNPRMHLPVSTANDSAFSSIDLLEPVGLSSSTSRAQSGTSQPSYNSYHQMVSRQSTFPQMPTSSYQSTLSLPQYPNFMPTTNFIDYQTLHLGTMGLANGMSSEGRNRPELSIPQIIDYSSNRSYELDDSDIIPLE